MRRLPRSATATAVLGLSVLFACGESTPVEPDPVATSITASAGDGQTAMTSTELPTALTVTILDDAGTAFSGATVAWSVISGGGSLSATESTTGADGTASTMWTLGQTAGVQTVRATSGSLAIDFTATAEAGPFMPTADVAISGTLDVTSFTIPAGVTVTADADVVINATETFVIDGSLVADCMAMEVMAVGDLTVTGTVQNGCDTTTADVGADLTLMSEGAFLFDSATISAMGAITISNVPASPVISSANAPRHHLGFDCRFRRGIVVAESYGGAGADGSPFGLDGPDGDDITVRCAGDVLLEGSRFEAQAGGYGGGGSAIDEPAAGGDGGNGGDIVIEAGENVSVVSDASGEPAVFVMSEGGSGGEAESEGFDAAALGGAGGHSGLVRITATGTITIEENNALTLLLPGAGGGDGGYARATGLAGEHATGGSPAEAGGDAEAVGGRGGNFGMDGVRTDLIGQLLVAPSVVNPSNIQLSIIDPSSAAGAGGNAWVDSGVGGNGDAENPDGGAGGAYVARGGEGGSITFYDNRAGGSFPGAAAAGGSANFVADGPYSGGMGFVGCSEGGNAVGGRGGAGGSVSGGGGLGGFEGEVRTGATGAVVFTNVANGGPGGSGEGPGAGGAAGAQIDIIGEQTVTNSFMAGPAGDICPGAQPPFISFEAAAAEAMASVLNTALDVFAVARTAGAILATPDGALVAQMATAASTTMYGVAGLGDAVGQFMVFGLTGIYTNTTPLPTDVPATPADVTLERASLSVSGVTDNDANTTDGVAFGNDPSTEGAVFAQNGDNNILIVTKDGTGAATVDPAFATIFKPGGVSIFGDDRVVSAFAGPNGFTESNPLLVVTEAMDGSGKLWRVDLVAGAAVATEETDVFVWSGPRRVRCIMPQGVCGAASFGSGSLGGFTLFTWDGGTNVTQVPGFSARAGSFIGVDLVPWGSDVGLVLPAFTQNQYTVDRLDSSTGEIIESNTYDAPAGCNPGHAIFRPRPGGGIPTEVLLSCNGTGEVVSVSASGPGS